MGDQMLRTMLLCALTAAIFFLPFYIIDGGFFHYAGDFNSQQISFYRYMNGFIKGAGYPDSAFTSVHNTFSWATDLGSGVMNAYSFYLYGSPFFWFSLLFPQVWLPYLMVPLLVLKFAVAGGGAYLYLRRYVKNIDYAVLGACLYTLSLIHICGSYYITYKETETTGYEGCTTTLKIAADGSRVAMLRFGKGGGAGTQLLIEKGKRNLCHYETGYGSMTLGVTADEIECGLTEKGGTAKFGYLLDANSAELVSRNRLEVTVTHVN